MYLGAHMSIAGGVHNALQEAYELNCTALQIFTKSNNRWKSKDLTQTQINLFDEYRNKTKIDRIISHTGYLINLANPKENWAKSMESMELEIVRAEQLGIPYLVLHPGSHLGKGETYGIKRIADSLNQLIDKYLGYKLKILLETTAGQGTNLGCSFEQLRDIIALINQQDMFGICFDTCHVFAAGYDLRTEESYGKTFFHFDHVLGIDNLLAFHLNDSKTPFNSKRDRHEHIGKGEIGLEPFRYLMNDKRFKQVPMILETPKENGSASDETNLSVLKSLVEN